MSLKSIGKLGGFAKSLNILERESDGWNTAFNAIQDSLEFLDITEAGQKLKDLKLNPDLSVEILESANSAGLLRGSTDEVTDGIKKMSAEAAESTGTMRDAFAGLGSKFKDFLLSPTTWAIAGGAIAAYALLSAETFDTLSEQAAKSQSEYESTKAELDSLNSELENTSSRIKELQSQGTLTLTEQGELENLQKTEESLKRQIDLKERLAQKQGDKASEDATKALNKKGIIDLTIDEKLDANSSKRELSEAYKDSDIVSATKNEVEALEEYYSSKEKLEKEYNKKGISTSRKKEINTELSDIEANIERYEDSLSEKMKKIEPLYQDLLNPDTGEAKKGSEKLAGKIEKIIDGYNSLGSSTSEKQAKALSKIWENDSFAQAQQKLVNAFRMNKNLSVDEITDQFPKLVEECNNAGISVETLRNEITALASQDTGMTQLEEEFTEFQNTAINAIAGIDTVNASLANSFSGKGVGLSIDTETGEITGDLETIKSAYQDLEGYDPAVLFEKTANGVHVNQRALRELQAQQEALQKADFLNQQKKAQEGLNQALADQADALQKYGQNSQEYQNAGLIVADYQSQLETIRQLSSAYDGATSAYQKWLNAQSSGEEGDMFRNVSETMRERGDELYKEGRYNTNEFRAIADYYSSEDLSTASVEELVAAYEKAKPTIDSFFTGGKEGLDNFISSMRQLSDSKNLGWVEELEDGKLKFNTGSDEEIAERLGISKEAVQALYRAMSEYTDQIVIGDTNGVQDFSNSIEEMKTKADEAKSHLEELGNSNIDLNFNFESTDASDLDAQIERAKANLDQFKNEDGTVNLDVTGAQDAVTILQTLVQQKQQVSQPAIMTIDTSGLDGGVASVVTKLQEYQTAVNELGTLQQLQGAGISVDTSQIDEAKTKVDTVFSELQGMSQEGSLAINADVKVDTSSTEALNKDLSSMTPEIKAKIVPSSAEADTGLDKTTTVTVNYEKGKQDPPSNKSADVNYKKGKQTKPSNKNAKVNYKKGTQAKPSSPKTATVNYKLGTVAKPPSVTVKVNYDTSGSPKTGTVFDGTAHANGTTRSYGNWGIKKNERALTGELGTETVVRNGKFFTVGNNGAEFVNLRAGDIVFNHKQTQELFKHGHVTSNGGRARVIGGAFAEGSAYSSGSWTMGNTGSGNLNRPTSYNAPVSAKKTVNNANNAKKAVDTASKATQDALDALSGYFDWIKIRFDRLSRDTDISEKTINTAIGLSAKQVATSNTITKVQSELNAQRAGYERYMSHAKWYAQESGLSSDLQQRVQNGTIDISKLDDDTKKKVNEYQSWYEEALSCLDKISELEEKETELAKKRLSNIEDFYKLVNDVHKSVQDANDSQLKYEEAMGFSAVGDSVSKMYKSSLDEAKKVYDNSVQQLVDYQNEFNNLVSQGYIKEGSDAYYEGQQKLNEFTQAVNDAATSAIEFEDKINEISYKKIQFIIDGLERSTSKIDKWITLQEARNNVIPESVYQDQLDSNNTQILKNKELRDKKLKEQGLYAVNSTRYQELAEEITKLDESILGTMADNEKLMDSIYELRFKPLDDVLKGYESVRSEIETFQSLLNKDAFFDKNGMITDEGIANLALLQQSMSIAKKQVSDYAEGLNKLQDSLDNNVISQSEYEKKSEEYRKGLQNAAIDVENYKDTISDLYMTQLKTEVSALQKIIDKRKEALDRKAQYYDYDRKLKSQTKDVDILKSQIAALEGVNNSYSKAEAKRLKQQLADAEEELNETKRQHSIDMQKEGYDGLSEDMEKMLEDTEYEIAHNAEKQQSIIQNMLNNVVGMYQSAYDKINSIIGNTGWVGSTDFNDNQTQLGTQEGATSQNQNATQTQPNVNPSDVATGTVTDKIDNNDSFNNQLEQEIMQKPNTDNRPVAELKANPTSLTLQEGKSSSISTSIRPTDAKNKTLSWKSSNTSIATVSGGTVKALKPGTCQVVVSTTDGSGLTVTIGVTVTKKPDPPKPKPTPKPSTGADGIARVGDVATYTGRYYYDSWGKRPAGNLYSGVSRGVVIDSYSGKEYGGKSSSHGGYGVHIKSADGRYGDLGWVSLSQLTGYKTGTKSVDKDKLAWTQEGGREMIIRPNGDMLTPLGQGDAVVPNKLTENLWEWGTYNPHEVIRNAAVPNVDYRGGGVVNIEQHYDSLLKVEGNVDKDALPGLKELLEKSYQYNINKMTRECIKTNGIKRRR